MGNRKAISLTSGEMADYQKMAGGFPTGLSFSTARRRDLWSLSHVGETLNPRISVHPPSSIFRRRRAVACLQPVRHVTKVYESPFGLFLSAASAAAHRGPTPWSGFPQHRHIQVLRQSIFDCLGTEGTSEDRAVCSSQADTPDVPHRGFVPLGAELSPVEAIVSRHFHLDNIIEDQPIALCSFDTSLAIDDGNSLCVRPRPAFFAGRPIPKRLFAHRALLVCIGEPAVSPANDGIVAVADDYTAARFEHAFRLFEKQRPMLERMKNKEQYYGYPRWTHCCTMKRENRPSPTPTSSTCAFDGSSVSANAAVIESWHVAASKILVRFAREIVAAP